MKKFNFSPGGGAGNDQGGSARVRRRSGVQRVRDVRRAMRKKIELLQKMQQLNN